jgi:uncharacterized protein (TIGR02453 family)
MAFAGFPPALFDFYLGLEADNSRAYWQAHKQVYETAVQAPMEALAEALTAEFGAAHIYRPYRDLRFSPDKRPYKEHAAMSVDDGSGGGYYFAISADGIHLGGGYWRPARDQLQRWRQSVDNSETADGLQKVLNRLQKGGFPLDTEGGLKTVPRGYDRDHPRANLLRLTDLTIGRRYEPDPWMHEPAALDIIRKGWRQIRTWGDWLREHVGPSQEQSEPR